MPTSTRHYGLGYSEACSDSGLPPGNGRDTVGRDTSGPTTDDAMTRSEEELRVGKASRESGRARLRNYVVTEQVQQTVPMQREEVRIEREPFTTPELHRRLILPASSRVYTASRRRRLRAAPLALPRRRVGTPACRPTRGPP